MTPALRRLFDQTKGFLGGLKQKIQSLRKKPARDAGEVRIVEPEDVMKKESMSRLVDESVSSLNESAERKEKLQSEVPPTTYHLPCPAEARVSEGIGGPPTNSDSTSILYKIKNWFKTKGGIFNSIAKIVVLLSPVLILGYVGIKIYDASKYQGSYSIDFSQVNFGNTNLPLYINEDSNSPKFLKFPVIDGKTTAQLEGSPLTFVFQPKEFPLKKKITFSAVLKDEGDWQISLVCPTCDSDSKYNWQPFYYGWLDNYMKAATIDDVVVYSKDSSRKLQDASNIDDWISKNVKKDDSISILDGAISKSKLVNQNVGFVDGATSVMDKTIRGPHDFYVYLKDKLDLQVIKKDLNNYDGADDVRVALYDLDDNSVGSDIVTDDGIATRSSEFAPVVRKSISFTVPHAGVYRLAFEEGDPTNAKGDWTITHFEINTNKVVFSDQKPTLFLEPVNLYTEIRQPTDLIINTWYKEQLQSTTVDSQKYKLTVTPTEQDINNNVITILLPEHYSISFNGNQKVGGSFFALKKENFFNPFTNVLDRQKAADLVFTRYLFKKIDNNWIQVEKIYFSDDLKNTTETNKITLSITNDDLNSRFKDENYLYEEGFYPLSAYKGYVLFGNKQASALNGDTSTSTDLFSWLKGVLPSGAVLKIDSSLTLNPKDISTDINKPVTFATSTLSIFDYALQVGQSNEPVLFKDINIHVE